MTRRRPFRVGDRVVITRTESVAHLMAGNGVINGEIIRIDEQNVMGNYKRPIIVMLDGYDKTGGYGETSWARWEICHE
jgi:hypothetical protein